MSYKKAMKHKPKKNKADNNLFCPLAKNERRKNPRLSIDWYVLNREDYKTQEEFELAKVKLEKERIAYIAGYHKETERMLKENPSLKIV